MLCQEMNDFHFLSQESCMTGAFACFQSGLRTCFAITYVTKRPVYFFHSAKFNSLPCFCKSLFCSTLFLRYYIFLDLSAHTFIASITALLSPFSSRTRTASIVVPAGEHTISFNSPGCFPVSSTIFALP